MKLCVPPIELLTDRSMLVLAEILIQGGVSSIYEKRLPVADNKYLPNHDTSKQSTFIVRIDANKFTGVSWKSIAIGVGSSWVGHMQSATLEGKAQLSLLYSHTTCRTMTCTTS